MESNPPDPLDPVDQIDHIAGQVLGASLLGAVLDSTAQAIVVFDLSGRVLLWNSSAERVFGWTAAEVIGRFTPHVPPEEREGFLKRLERLGAGEEWIGRRSTRRRKDGSTVELSVSSSSLRTPEGRVAGIVSVISDVTAVIAIERARDDANRLFRAAFENAPNGVMLSNPAGRFIDVNRAACEILRRERDELLSTGFASITHPDELKRSLAGRARVLAGEVDTYRSDTRYLAPDGSTIWTDLSISLVRDDRGEPQFTIAQIVDVASRREAERAIAEGAFQIEAISGVIHKLLTADDARPLICTAVADVIGADSVSLSERRADGSVEITAATMAGPVGTVFAPGSQSLALQAVFGGESVFVADTRDSTLVTGLLADQTGARSALFEPVRGEHGVVAGLTIVWREAVGQIEPRTLEVVQLLAAEAAIAIERTNLLRQFQEQALTDELTGLPNRRSFVRSCEREIARSQRSGTCLVLAMVDLDNFKDYNDTHGHVEGDRLLRTAAVSWRARLRGGDILARVGGEEFVALLADIAEDSATATLDRLLEVEPGGPTCSIGYAVWRREESAESLLQRADAALYRAKGAGRNRVVMAD